ncbi:MAG: tetratricopeptide repeat protein [Planctomycetota bacterium]
MLGDSFLFNFVVFALGQFAAWGYLRTGRIPRGATLAIGAWVLADIALVAKFAYEGGTLVAGISLALMQIYSLTEFGLFVYGRWRRQGATMRSEQEELHREAFVHYLRNELEPAGDLYRKLLRRDPWDAEAALSLGRVLDRAGDAKPARRWLRVARSLDRSERYRDFIGEELRRTDALPRGAEPQPVDAQK